MDLVGKGERAFQHLASRAGSAGERAEKGFKLTGMQSFSEETNSSRCLRRVVGGHQCFKGVVGLASTFLIDAFVYFFRCVKSLAPPLGRLLTSKLIGFSVHPN